MPPALYPLSLSPCPLSLYPFPQAGKNAVMYAAQEGRVEVCRLLLEGAERCWPFLFYSILYSTLVVDTVLFYCILYSTPVYTVLFCGVILPPHHHAIVLSRLEQFCPYNYCLQTALWALQLLLRSIGKLYFNY